MLRNRALGTALLLLPLSPLLYGQSTSSTIQGIAEEPAGQPLAQAQVVVHSVNENTDRRVVTASDGSFLVENLKQGEYQVTAEKEGFARSKAKTIELGPQQKVRVDVTLASANGSKGTSEVAPSAPPQTSNSGAPLTEREKQLLDRIESLEKRLATLEAKGANQSAAAPTQALVASQENSSSQPAQPAQASGDKGAGNAGAPAKPVLVASTDTVAQGWQPPDSPAATPTTDTTGAKPKKPKIEPFSDVDWTWLNGSPRTKDVYWDTKFFTPEIRADTNYNWQNHHPGDHSLGGSSEIFREGEVQLEQLGVGGDFHWDNVRARFMTQFGMYSETTPRNDASPANGQWNLDTAYRYLSEAYGGYHFNVMDGINVDAGIFLSYIGLFSYYNFDNWAYQPSYVSSNTPWFFNGVRVQVFPTAHLKIEPWFINGWQSYGSANNRPGLGGQIKWTPYSWMNIIANNYGLGQDDLYVPGRSRIHTDDSIEIKYYDHEGAKGLDKMAFSFTGDLGCEYGSGVSCTGNHKGGPKQSFIGAMLYNRWWFHKDEFGVTLGGGGINNPGRYLVLLPPINGMTAPSAARNSPYFTENPGDKFKAWDSSLTFDWMPKQYITFRIEGDYRHANVPYWSGRGGITPPPYVGTPADFINGNGYPTEYACSNGAPSGQTALSAAETACGGVSKVWFPNLVKSEFVIDFDILVKF
jgi:Putative beta-barrel porin-2, OmpL-like. bbp2/Carboxypeptidase regulatory-like domain